MSSAFGMGSSPAPYLPEPAHSSHPLLLGEVPGPLELRHLAQQTFSPIWGIPKEIAYYGFRRIRCQGKSDTDCQRSYFEAISTQGPFDLASLSQLNERAARTWKVILALHHGQLSDARIAYQESKLVLESLRAVEEIRRDLRSIAQSARLHDFYGVYQIEALHPLLIQIAIEEMFFDNLRNSELEEVRTFSAESRVQSAIQSESTDSLTLSIRRLFFYHQLLDAIPGDDCEAWGLFPHSFYRVVPALSNASHARMAFFHDRSRLLRISEKTAHACSVPGEQLSRFLPADQEKSLIERFAFKKSQRN